MTDSLTHSLTLPFVLQHDSVGCCAPRERTFLEALSNLELHLDLRPRSGRSIRRRESGALYETHGQIEKALSPTEQLILDMLSTVRVIGIDPAAIVDKPDPLKVFVNRLQEMLAHVARFNDPKGVYANCFCEID